MEKSGELTSDIRAIFERHISDTSHDLNSKTDSVGGVQIYHPPHHQSSPDRSKPFPLLQLPIQPPLLLSSDIMKKKALEASPTPLGQWTGWVGGIVVLVALY